ncbi:MAG: hypothetical protein P1V81_13700 [Planctomycetota bacterium]|nr:hypothetical protein [Planctomycetota bacterium]
MLRLTSLARSAAFTTAVAICTGALTASASDLKLDGQVNLSKAIGTTLQVDLTGNPGLAAMIVVDNNAGPITVLGESIPIGLSGASFFLPSGTTDGGGLYSVSAGVPALPGLVGTTWYVLGAVLDSADPNGYDFSNGASVTFTLSTPNFAQTELAGNSLAQRPFFEWIRAVNEGSTVEVAIDAIDHPTLVGQSVDLYVVPSKTAAEWDASGSLFDVSSGGAETVTISGGGIALNTYIVDTGTLNGTLGAELGVGYDVVVDVDQDGTLSPGDLIDGYGDQSGFYAVHDLVQPGPYAVTESIYTGGAWKDQDTYYPTNIASLGKLPLIVISHGNGHNYQWYDHLGYHLASYGYVVMSHSNNTGPGIETASQTTLDNTDGFLGGLGGLLGGVLDGHVDADNIIWFGHSRGGEGVARAYDKIVDGTYVPANFSLSDIKLVSSIAPTDFLGTNSATSHGANYHLWVGQADSDVSGCTSSNVTQSFHLLDRALNQSQSISLQGVGHTWFHDNGGFSWASGPCLLNEAKTHLIMKGYILPLVKYHLEGNYAAKDYLTRQYESFHPISAPVSDPCVVVDLQFKEANESGKYVIDDFQTSALTTVASSGAAVSFTVQSVNEGRMDDNNSNLTHNTGDIFNGFTQSNATDFSRGLVFSFDGVGDRHLTYDIPAIDGDWTSFEKLAFRACQGTRHPLTTASLGDTTFEVELVDGSGNSSVISIGAYGGGIEEPYQRTGCGSGTGWSNEFETIRLDLEGFTVDDAAFDLSDVDKLIFRFGPSHGTPTGRLGMDDIELTK